LNNFSRAYIDINLNNFSRAYIDINLNNFSRAYIVCAYDENATGVFYYPTLNETVFVVPLVK
jgi:N-formylglutamate amidohydrolase